MLLSLPQPQSREVPTYLPFHRSSWSVAPIRDGDDFLSFQFIPAHSPLPRIELHRNQSLGIERIPEIVAPVVWEAIVLVLVHQHRKFNNGHGNADELAGDTRTTIAFNNLAFVVQIPFLWPGEPIGKLVLGPLIVLAHVDRTLGTFAGIEGLGHESENAVSPGSALALVVGPGAV